MKRSPGRRVASALSIVLLVLTASRAAAQAGPAGPAPRTQRQGVASLQKRVLALAAIERMTVQGAAEALGVTLQSPEQIHERRREWPLTPNEVIAGGEIIEAGSNILIEIKPAPTLRLSFEELAAILMKQPYYLDPRESHVGADSVATKIYAIDHAFRVKAGELRVQVPVTLAPDTPNHGVQAIRRGYNQALGAPDARDARVDAIFFSTDVSRAPEPSMSAPLDQRRKRRAKRAN